MLERAVYKVTGEEPNTWKSEDGGAAVREKALSSGVGQ